MTAAMDDPIYGFLLEVKAWIDKKFKAISSPTTAWKIAELRRSGLKARPAIPYLFHYTNAQTVH